MWVYQKTLEHPVDLKKSDPNMAKLIMTQLGGPNGELAAAIRYLQQRYTMPTGKSIALLTDIGTEEMAHVEILVAMIKGLTKGATALDFKKAGIEGLYADHGLGIYPTDAGENPFTVLTLASSGDYITDLTEDMAAEEKARAVYEHLMDLTDNPEILGPLSFLRQREIVHYQRFAEALKYYKDKK